MKPAQPPSRFRAALREIAVTGGLFLFITTCVVQAHVIPTSSMDGTLLVGDHVLVEKLFYPGSIGLVDELLPTRTIERGDIVVFLYPLDESEHYVKRLIGLPGDRIRIEDKQVFVNGETIVESYKRHADALRLPGRDDFPGPPPMGADPRGREMLRAHVSNGELVVPDGSYFVLGDNRDNSADSRYWGFVPRENLLGKPVVVYWSFDAPTEEWENSFSLDHFSNLALHFFDKTRWARTGLLPD